MADSVLSFLWKQESSLFNSLLTEPAPFDRLRASSERSRTGISLIDTVLQFEIISVRRARQEEIDIYEGS